MGISMLLTLCRPLLAALGDMPGEAVCSVCRECREEGDIASCCSEKKGKGEPLLVSSLTAMERRGLAHTTWRSRGGTTYVVVYTFCPLLRLPLPQLALRQLGLAVDLLGRLQRLRCGKVREGQVLGKVVLWNFLVWVRGGKATNARRKKGKAGSAHVGWTGESVCVCVVRLKTRARSVPAGESAPAELSAAPPAALSA